MQPNLSRPYLSVVVTTRNDDHGGSLLDRTQAFVNGLLSQCRRHKVPAELIIVEWNPPPDRPPLAEALHWRDSEGWCQVRILEVPLAIHQRWRTWKALPLYQMTAKNVGIRRARGEFVLATNIDILFSDELMSLIAERKLDAGKMYRVTRWDIMPQVPVHGTVEEQLAYCQSHLIRLNAREGSFRVRPDGSRLIEENDIIAREGALQLGDNWYHRELSGDEAFRWAENDPEIMIEPEASERTLAIDIEPGPGANTRPLMMELRDGSGKCVAEVLVKRRSVIEFKIAPFDGSPQRFRVHTRNGGAQISSDMRTLNFRVFRCSVGTGGRMAATEPGVAAVRTTKSAVSRAGRALKLLRDIWRGNPNTLIRLPMSRERIARLQLRQDETGLSFSPGAFRSSAPSDAVFPVGMQMQLGTGWYPIEHFSGETFYWMKQKASILWLPPQDPPPAFVLHVEPGPAAGFKQCDVILRDQWGKEIATHTIKGRSQMRIPLGASGGPLPMSFEVRGSTPAASVSGDSREMALRIFGSAWEGKPSQTGAGDRPIDLKPLELVQAGPGVSCGSGWTHVERLNTTAPSAYSGAELLLRPPDAADYALGIEVVPIVPPRPGEAAAELIVEDAYGGVMFKGPIEDAREIRIDAQFSGAGRYALRLAGGPADKPEDPWLIVPAIHWTNIQTGERVRMPLRLGSSDRPVHLHTNACGDFTMLALDRWIDLRGYPELDLYSLNIDSLFCWAAHHGGAREEVLGDPYRVYHIEHGEGSGWTPEGEQRLYDRLSAKGVSWLEFKEVMSWARVMNRFDMPMIFNRDDWGLGKDELKETIPAVSAKKMATDS